MGDELEVVIDDTTYSLVVPPRSDTELVVAERKKLLGHIDLKTLVEDLSHVGKCIRVASNGVTAAGPKFTELQIEIQDLGYDVTKLCDKSAITVSKFQRACATIITDLQATYEYLLDNLEDVALDTLASVSKLAGQMAEAAKELQEAFDNQANKVRKVAKKTQMSQGQQAQLVQTKQKEEEQLKEKQKLQDDAVKGARRAEVDAEQAVREYEMKEDEAIEALGDDGSILVRLINGLTSSLLGARVLGVDGKGREKKVQHWKEKKIEALHKRQETETLRKEALQQLAEFAIKISECSGEKEMAETAYQALHSAMGGLKTLAVLMRQASLFWEQMKEHCMALGEAEVVKSVEKEMGKDAARRRKIWTSKGFKRRAVNFYAGWVALHGVCGEYMLTIQDTQRDLYRYITENPTYEEAEQNIKVLAEEFKNDVHLATRALEEREYERDAEIKSLMDEDKQ